MEQESEMVQESERMMWFRKKRKEDFNPEPPFPLDKPHSCRYCKHSCFRGCKFKYIYCTITNEPVGYKELYRTWDRCDKFEPYKACSSCKHLNREVIIVGDAEEQAKVCDVGADIYHSIGCDNWELKE